MFTRMCRCITTDANGDRFEEVYRDGEQLSRKPFTDDDDEDELDLPEVRNNIDIKKR